MITSGQSIPDRLYLIPDSRAEFCHILKSLNAQSKFIGKVESKAPAGLKPVLSSDSAVPLA